MNGNTQGQTLYDAGFGVGSASATFQDTLSNIVNIGSERNYLTAKGEYKSGVREEKIGLGFEALGFIEEEIEDYKQVRLGKEVTQEKLAKESYEKLPESKRRAEMTSVDDPFDPSTLPEGLKGLGITKTEVPQGLGIYGPQLPTEPDKTRQEDLLSWEDYRKTERGKEFLKGFEAKKVDRRNLWNEVMGDFDMKEDFNLEELGSRYKQLKEKGAFGETQYQFGDERIGVGKLRRRGMMEEISDVESLYSFTEDFTI